MAAAYSIVSGGGKNRVPLELIPDVAEIAALAAWRMTKGVYRFDPDIYDALWDTPITGDLPSELLLRLPEWCVYIETPGQKTAGFFAHLEHDANDGHRELRIIRDHGTHLESTPIDLIGTLEEGLESVLAEAERLAPELLAQYGVSRQADESESARALAPLVNLVLYLCSEQPDILGKGYPSNPQPKRTKRGTREFAADGVRIWQVGSELGRKLRAIPQRREGGEHGSVAPHIRRAHWHVFRVGKGRTERVLKWLNPIFVNAPEE